jgi:hypothetical protein
LGGGGEDDKEDELLGVVEDGRISVGRGSGDGDEID